MAPRPTTKRRDDGMEQATVSILEHFSLPGSEAARAANAPKPKGPSVEDLQAQLEAMNKRLDEAQRTNNALMSQPLVTAPTTARQDDIVVDTSNLPDPVTETEKYNKELAARTLKAVQAQTQRDRDNENQRRTQEQSADQRANALWEDFQSAYPAYAEQDDRVRYVAESVATKARARGVDVEKYMFGPGRTQYMKDVAEQYEAMWPTAEGGSTEDQPQPQYRAPAQDRTVGIFGGAEAGNKPSKPAATNPNAPQPGSMTRDLSDLQRASGFF